ncbi:PilZ domain-containing protein [Clostridium fallax]|uniref:PilZ domain-containing protein n=1 Tax=Clostridium fallax TaxID=1533 RepID=A0A1M4UIW1_9CLOT|nr:PilZ domain-containing protein [Clostridium fallax]SHE56595.1 PilZ domain-containing protein [Clostridium fallax]SQB07586.1 putative glycosyltransferase [Clostridium fallax]
MFNLSIHDKLGLIIQDNIYMCNVKCLEEGYFILNTPFKEKESIILSKGKIIETLNYDANGNLYKFSLEVLDKKMNYEKKIVCVCKYCNDSLKVEKIDNITARFFELIKYSKGFIKEEIFKRAKKSNGILININETGIRFKTRETLNLGDELTFEIKNDEDYLITKGAVRRVENTNNKEFLYGVNFYNNDKKEKEKIIKMLVTIIKKQRKLL